MVLDELVGVAREVACEKELFPAEGLILVERLLGRGLEELEVSGRDLARELDVLGKAVESVDGEWRVGEDEGGLAVVVPGVAHTQGASLPHGTVKRNQVTGCPVLANFRLLSRFGHFAGQACVVCDEGCVPVRVLVTCVLFRSCPGRDGPGCHTSLVFLLCSLMRFLTTYTSAN